MGDLLAVGHVPLEDGTLVRIQVPQPRKIRLLRAYRVAGHMKRDCRP